MLIAIGSLKASPGVSTVALATASLWPTGVRRVLVEADSCGGDLAARFGLSLAPGLVSLAAAARHHKHADMLWEHTQQLGDLSAVIAPPGAEHATACLTALFAAGPGLLENPSRDGTTVIVDCGRLTPGSPALDLARGADRLLVVCRPRADELAHLAARRDTLTAWNPRTAIVLVGDGYNPAEVAQEIDLPVLAHIPDDPHTAGALTGHPCAGRPRRRGDLETAVARLVASLNIDGPRDEPAAPEPAPQHSAPQPVGGDTDLDLEVAGSPR